MNTRNISSFSGYSPIDFPYKKDISKESKLNTKLNEFNIIDPYISSGSLVIKHEIDELLGKVVGIERQDMNVEIYCGTKMCPTRHGCTGATNCNYDLASYPG